MRPAVGGNLAEGYVKYTQRKAVVIALLVCATLALALYALNAGSAPLPPAQVLQALLGRAEGRLHVIVWQIRLPRVLGAVVAGAGLAVAGCAMQNLLRNPLASPFTLGVSQGAAFGAAVAIISFGAGSIQSTSADAVIIDHPYLVSAAAFGGAMAATVVILFLARVKEVSPEAMVLAGVALGSLFSAATTLLQYFAQEVQVASLVFWTFGDLGRLSWWELEIMAAVVGGAWLYFLAHRWDYNALDGGEEAAKALGVEVEKVRLNGMFVASLVTAVAVAFLGIIGFIGLVAPHMMRRLLGGDHRFLLPAASAMGGLLLLAADTLGRTVIAPVVLPVGAITSFMGAPLFLYLLARGYSRK
ncbi:MAG: iron ABC transporter permease [Bacillota bacterium]|nr:iron ABC transporter permease [Bacillota bacterium]